MTARTLEPFDPDVVAPWDIGSGDRAAVLLHGFAGTPPELRALGEFLVTRGWHCAAPALAGHGATPADLANTGWRDWAGSALDVVDRLAAECSCVVVIGQSMGGTLALHCAATDSRIAAAVTLAAPIKIKNVARPFMPVLKRLRRWHYPRSESDLFRKEGVEELHSYGKRSMNAIHELFRLTEQVADELAMVRQPVLLLHGARDSVVDPRNLELIRSRLVCAATVDSKLFARSGHAMSVDVDRTEVNALVADWLDAHVSSAASTSQRTSGKAKATASAS